jgi:inner membrane protein
VYGTQLLAPLSNHRFTLSAVPIIDPIYTGILLVGLIFGFIFRKRIWASSVAASLALVITSGYLFYGLAQNDQAYSYAVNQLKEEGHAQGDVRAYTTMFQIFLRRIVVHFPEDVWVGYVTTWAPQKIVWHKHVQAPEAIRTAILNHPNGKIYRWFTNDELIFQPHLETPSKWEMIDSRFGFLGPTNLGIWGRTVTVNAQGRVEDDFPHFRTPLKITLPDIEYLWKAAFGRVIL